MRFYSLFLFSLILIIPIANATEHTLSTEINYHSAQDSGTGYGIIYQYKFLENIEFEAKYQYSGDLKVIEQEEEVFGDYNSFSTGINFIKPYHQKLSVKISFGANIITGSTNKLLIEENDIAPYFQIAVKYKITNHVSITLGQSSQFNQDVLGTNHSLFLSLNWLFSQQASKPLVINTDKNDFLINNNKLNNKDSQQNVKTVTTVKPKRHTDINKKLDKNPLISAWYVQIGAYKNNINAQIGRAHV